MLAAPRRVPLLLAYVVVVALLVGAVLVRGGARAGVAQVLADAPLSAPADWLEAQRAVDWAGAGRRAFEAAAAQSQALEAETVAEAPELAAADWVLEGPTNVGGRITDLVVHPTEEDVVYAAAASGGVWVTRDAGATWQTAWPEDLTQAIGALAITPDGTLFAGTGETSPGGGSLTFGGTGVYRSTDGGASWERVGLPDSGAIGRIVVDPEDPDRIYVAASGDLYVPGGERGVYRSLDGGDTWELVLEGANATTGAADLSIDPANADVVFAAMWDHIRRPEGRVYGGVGSALYRSTDGGETWAPVAGVPGPGDADVGRIGVAVAPSAPNLVYAIVVDASGDFRSFHRSVDGGASFVAQPTAPNVPVAGSLVPTLAGSQSTFGWWFGRVFVDPVVPTHVFVPGVPLLQSLDGGLSFVPDLTVHADQHIVAWDPNVPNRVWLGNDGGTYVSTNNGATWTATTQQPINQLYTIDVSETNPERLVAGLQDNGANRNYGADRVTGADRWEEYNGGDGLEAIINPQDANNVFGCSQYGNCVRSTDAGDNAAATRGPGTRRNWLAPLEFDPNDPAVMYYASEVVSRSTDNGRTWTAISGDLTDGDPEDPQYPFGTITVVAPAASDPQRLYVGTDDGKVWTTRDLGGTWEQLEDDDLPALWVTRIVVDPRDADVAYASFSGFRSGDDAARVAVTTDGGATWTNVSGDLPAAPVNDLELAGAHGLLAATDVGVFLLGDLAGLGEDGGDAEWRKVGTNLPLAPVMDLRYHAGTDAVVAGTFGRSAWRAALPPVAG